MTELVEDPSAAVEALPLGPQSLIWRYFGDNRMFLIGPRPAVLQNMLAELGQGVLDHSVFFADSAARVKRSLPPIYLTVYGSDHGNPGQQVRDYHHHVKGEMPGRTGGGARYHALDPDTYFWAHATFVESPAAWRVIAVVLNPVAAFLTTGAMPPSTRAVLGLPWSDARERRYQRFAACWRSRPVNWVWDHLPMRVRYNTFARAGYARG